jgi:hypothetical protein
VDVKTPPEPLWTAEPTALSLFSAVFEAVSSSFGILPNGRHGGLLDVNFGVITPKNRPQSPAVAGFCLTSQLTSKM